MTAPLARAADLAQVLDARERRAQTQEALLRQYENPLVCITMNLAGYVKRYALSDRFFEEGIEMIETQLERARMQVAFRRIVREQTGCEGYFSVRADALTLKKYMARLEDAFPAARLWDIDVIGTDGKKISGAEIGRGARRCLVCENDAASCGRSRAHALSQVHIKTLELLRGYFQEKDAGLIAAQCARALLCEVCVTPKPGLVDRQNTGAHHDMDIFTFMDSAAALTPYLRDFTLDGLRFGAPPLESCARYLEHPHGAPGDGGAVPEGRENALEKEGEQFLSGLRLLGMRAEKQMRRATGGVNTHKGILFSMGLVSAAAGYLLALNNPELASCQDGETACRKAFTLEELLSCVSKLAQMVMREDFPALNRQNAATAGERLYLDAGVTGVRGEAAAGFPSAVNCALPALRRLLRDGFSLNDAGARVLPLLLSRADDTNIVARSNRETQKELREGLKRYLEKTPLSAITTQWIQGMDEQFIKQNLSPGGSADLLALSFLLLFLAGQEILTLPPLD